MTACMLRRRCRKAASLERPTEAPCPMAARPPSPSLTSTCCPKPFASASCFRAAATACIDSSTASRKTANAAAAWGSSGWIQCTRTSPAGTGCKPSGPSCGRGMGAGVMSGPWDVSCTHARGCQARRRTEALLTHFTASGTPCSTTKVVVAGPSDWGRHPPSSAAHSGLGPRTRPPSGAPSG